MKKLLSDISVSRSAPTTIFLELGAAARACIHEQHNVSTILCDIPHMFNVFLFLFLAVHHHIGSKMVHMVLLKLVVHLLHLFRVMMSWEHRGMKNMKVPIISWTI